MSANHTIEIYEWDIKMPRNVRRHILPMNETVYASLKKMLERRPKVKAEPMVDGYSGFIMLDKNGNPKVALYI